MADFQQLNVSAQGGAIHVSFSGARDGETWGWQAYDPQTATYLYEGDWCKATSAGRVDFDVKLPAAPAPYRIYVSRVSDQGWGFARGEPMLAMDTAFPSPGVAQIAANPRVTTRAALRRAAFSKSIPDALAAPFRTLRDHAALIRQMVIRDIQVRYRGSFGDVLWTVLNPLLLMAAYYFVFGVVLSARFPGDPSRSGFVLYFLAGMLPWIAFSEAIGHAPGVIVQHRVYVKKLLFPIETLPVNLVMSGLVSGMFALLVFAAALVLARGAFPLSAAWLPVVIVPQVLFTMGLCWWLAAAGVYFRDLGQIMGFVLTLWFFLTPICYSDASLPQWALPVLGKNPIYIIVRGYRAVLLENRAPEWQAIWKLWLLAAIVFVTGFAWFRKLRRKFADVL